MDKKICELKLIEIETVVGGIAEAQFVVTASAYQSMSAPLAATTVAQPNLTALLSSLHKR